MTTTSHPTYSQVSPSMGQPSIPSITQSPSASPPNAHAMLNGFDVTKLPSILTSCVAKLWPGSNGLFWEAALEKMPERIEYLMTKSNAVSADDMLAALSTFGITYDDEIPYNAGWFVTGATSAFTNAEAAAKAATKQAACHPDDAAIDRFAAAMKAKMAASRAKGRAGWGDPAQCPTERLQTMLHDHVAKGDPVDVGNFAMMLFCRGDSTASEKPTGGYDEALCARAYGAAWPKVKGYIDGLNAARAERRNCDRPTAVGAADQKGGAA